MFEIFNAISELARKSKKGVSDEFYCDESVFLVSGSAMVDASPSSWIRHWTMQLRSESDFFIVDLRNSYSVFYVFMTVNISSLNTLK